MAPTNLISHSIYLPKTLKNHPSTHYSFAIPFKPFPRTLNRSSVPARTLTSDPQTNSFQLCFRKSEDGFLYYDGDGLHEDKPLFLCKPQITGNFEANNEALEGLKILGSINKANGPNKLEILDIFRILKIWKAPDFLTAFALNSHSFYSDSSTGRGHVVKAAEYLIHLFRVVSLRSLIYNYLLFHYSDEELVQHLKVSEISLRNAKEKGSLDEEEEWRKKLQSLLPSNGLILGEDIAVSRRVVAIFLLLTMADFSDQRFGFQEELSDISDSYAALWPREGKPGLWMNLISRMGAVYNLIVREEEIFMEERRRLGGGVLILDRDEDLELVIPPVFENCTKVLDGEKERVARDLYWEADYYMSKRQLERAEEVLVKCVENNPFVGEFRVVLGQIYWKNRRFEEAERETKKGQSLLLEWGGAWDRRTSWEAWIGWNMVLMKNIMDRDFLSYSQPKAISRSPTGDHPGLSLTGDQPPSKNFHLFVLIASN